MTKSIECNIKRDTRKGTGIPSLQVEVFLPLKYYPNWQHIAPDSPDTKQLVRDQMPLLLVDPMIDAVGFLGWNKKKIFRF